MAEQVPTLQDVVDELSDFRVRINARKDNRVSVYVEDLAEDVDKTVKKLQKMIVDISEAVLKNSCANKYADDSPFWKE